MSNQAAAHSWQALYRSYDDASLEVLANAGLLRRAYKDVESGKVAWLTEASDHGVLSSDGQQVTLNAKGAQAAQCDCPATSCCKHILAAILWLRNQPECASADVAANITASSGDENSQQQEASEHVGVTKDILALIPEQLFKVAGKAATRLAGQWFAQSTLSSTAAPVQLAVEAHRVTIHLYSIESSVIYLAYGGFAGMLSEVRASERHAVHLWALAEVFRQHQQPWRWPDVVPESTVTTGQLSPDELNLLANIAAIQHELLSQGLSHVSRSSATTLRMLNLSDRAEGLPLPAGHLPTFSGWVKQLAGRSDPGN